eukprot:GDKI01026578.1.p1 GENE.GDKI01026578.1~~GDKI01026578.1.p1  ORF type:complete len:242 (+),score=58.20 GDKI01026578.1:362-1087(+)
MYRYNKMKIKATMLCVLLLPLIGKVLEKNRIGGDTAVTVLGVVSAALSNVITVLEKVLGGCGGGRDQKTPETSGGKTDPQTTGQNMDLETAINRLETEKRELEEQIKEMETVMKQRQSQNENETSELRTKLNANVPHTPPVACQSGEDVSATATVTVAGQDTSTPGPHAKVETAEKQETNATDRPNDDRPSTHTLAGGDTQPVSVSTARHAALPVTDSKREAEKVHKEHEKLNLKAVGVEH